MNSVWTDTVNLPKFPHLKGNLKTDVLIIGGGITGILCAYMLHQAGIHYALVEADTICSGVTKNTTAKITSQHGLIYDKLIREFGTEKAALYLKANETALSEYEKICSGIQCDFEKKDAFVYSINNKNKLEQEIQALEKIGYSTQYVENLPLPFSTEGAVVFKNQAQFHPLKMIEAIAGPLNIYEHTKVTELGVQVAKTNYGEINAENIIVATHFPFNNKHGAYFLKMYQSRSYVLALKNAQNVNGMYVDEADKGLSFRNYNDYLLLGGGGHRTGKKGGNYQELLDFTKKYYPNAKVEYTWATQDCMTLDNVPYIGIYGKNTEGFYVMTGFNKWGMTSSMVSAILMRDMILEKENEFVSLFSPQRTMMRHQLLVNGFEATKNLLTISKKRCPHLGCALKWNEAEQTWDCPCHGSRFTEKGEVIDNPATDDLKDLGKTI